MNYIILGFGLLILVTDAHLAIEDRVTISQWCQELFPTWLDWIIGVGGWVGLCVLKHYWPGFDFTLGVVIAGFWGHIWLPNRERYRNERVDGAIARSKK